MPERREISISHEQKENHKNTYFAKFALSHLKILKEHVIAGHKKGERINLAEWMKNIKKTGQGDWSGVFRHCIFEGAVMKELAARLKLDLETTNRLIDAAILHDLNKRAEIAAMHQAGQTGDRTAIYERQLELFYQQLKDLNASPQTLGYIQNMGHHNSKKMMKPETPLELKLLYYLDNVSQGDKLVSVKKKFDYLTDKYPNLAKAEEYDDWQAGTEAAQKEIAEAIGLEDPEKLPGVLQEAVVRNFNPEELPKYLEKWQNISASELLEKTGGGFSKSAQSSLEAALKAGNEALKIRLNPYMQTVTKPEVQTKNIAYVTQGDVEAQKIIHEKLSRQFPESSFIMEEKEEGAEAKADNTADIMDQDSFIVDPIDGTSNYRSQGKQWAVSIGEFSKGEFRSGVIFAPQMNSLIFAEQGKGAWQTDSGGNLVKLDSLDEQEPTGKISVGTDIPVEPRFQNFASKLAENEKNYVTGSCATGFAEVLQGKTDAMVQPIQFAWDWAGGKAALEEVGGKMIFFRYTNHGIEKLEQLDTEVFNPNERTTAFIAGKAKVVDQIYLELKSHLS